VRVTVEIRKRKGDGIAADGVGRDRQGTLRVPVVEKISESGRCD
jgi:hypothetical protein